VASVTQSTPPVNAVLEAARGYAQLGLQPVPVKRGTKACTVPGWPNLRLGSEEQLRKHFANGNQIGLLLGLAPHFLADVDCDCLFAVRACQHYPGPHTDRVQGRPGNPSSHYFFFTQVPALLKKFVDPTAAGDAATIIELRGKDSQTVVAPSIHESGEQISWERQGDFGVTTVAELERYVSRIAAIALLAKHYPARNHRHDFAFALAGWLGLAGWGEADVAALHGAIARAAEDPSVQLRERDVKSTFKRLLAGNEKVQQRSHLEKLLGGNGKILVATAAMWLGLQKTGAQLSAVAHSDIIGLNYEVKLRSFDKIEKEHLEYLWPKYLPIGKPIHLAGNSGEGKSPVTVDLAARVSTGGKWPDGTTNTHGKRSVLMLFAEDDAADTVRPRLELAGADLAKIHQVVCTVKFGDEHMETETLLALSENLGMLLEKARELPDLALIIIDPVTNYLGPNVKMNSEEDVRRVLMPLSVAAKDLGASIVTVGHLNKRLEGSPQARVMGAAAFYGVARFVYMVGADPEDADKHAHILVQQRGVGAPTLRYQTYAKTVEWDGKTSDVVGITWRGVSAATGEDVVNPQSHQEKSIYAKAGKIVAEILKFGKQKKDDVMKQLEDAGYAANGLNSTRLLEAAKAKSDRFPGEKYYSWYLPEQTTKPKAQAQGLGRIINQSGRA
jgi:hypothetical protein